MSMIKNNIKKSILVFISILLVVSFIFYRQQRSFTKEKWLEYPNKRYLIVESLIEKHKFLNMTKEQIINLLGTSSAKKMYGFTHIVDSNFNMLDPNSIFYLTSSGEVPEDFRGLYFKFDKNNNIIYYTEVHFST